MKTYLIILLNHAGRPYMKEMSGKSLEGVLKRLREEDANTVFQVLLFP